MKSQRCTHTAIKPAAKLLLACSLLGLALQASAQTTVADAWVRATVPGQASTGIFMTVTSTTDSKLVGVHSPAAKTVQIHRSTMKNDVMQMEPVKSVALPAGKAVAFDPEHYHVMLIDLSGQIKEGDSVPLRLTVDNPGGKKETVNVTAKARALNSTD